MKQVEALYVAAYKCCEGPGFHNAYIEKKVFFTNPVNVFEAVLYPSCKFTQLPEVVHCSICPECGARNVDAIFCGVEVIETKIYL